MAPSREPDFVFLPVEEAEALVAAAYADGRLSSRANVEQLVRRQPPDYEAQDVVKVPAFLMDSRGRKS